MLTRADDFDNIIVAAVLALLFFCAEYSLERYRSGHNEAVLKTVCPKGHMGSNPILSADTLLLQKNKRYLFRRQLRGEIPKRPKGLPWKGSRSLIAARGFKSLFLRQLICQAYELCTFQIE